MKKKTLFQEPFDEKDLKKRFEMKGGSLNLGKT